MAHIMLDASRQRAGRRAAMTLIAFVAGTALAVSAAMAQQPAAKKSPEKAPAAVAPAAAAPAKAADAGAPQSLWVKLCEQAQIYGRDKDGKETATDKKICLTHHERLDANTGLVIVSAAIRQVEGADKSHLMVMVPLGMSLPPGMRAVVYTKDQVDKIQKNEKIDEAKIKPTPLSYTLCHPAGCTAEIEMNADLLKEMKTGASMMIFVVSASGQPIPLEVPLVGFDGALTGGPVDNKVYGEERRQLMTQIAARQQQMIEEFQKANQQLQGTQGGIASGAAPAAPAAKGAPVATGSTPKK